MASTIFANLKRPGVFLREGQAGYRSLPLASHTTSYMIGSGASGGYDTPTLVTSLPDFTNQFGASPSTNSVKLFFRNNKEGVLFFVRTRVAQKLSIVATTAAVGAYTVTINGTANTYTAITGVTKPDIITGLISLINVQSGAIASAIAGASTDTLIVRSKGGTTLTVTVTGSLTSTDVTGTTPTAADYVGTIEAFSDPEDQLEQGFILSPEAFQLLTTASDRLIVGNSMEKLASSDGYDWIALVDAPQAAITVAALQTDSAQYTTAKGHLNYYAPYGIDTEDATVPLSAAIAALAGLKYRQQGFQEPIGGTQYRIAGLKNLTKVFKNVEQDVLNPIGVNLIRNLRNKGIVLFGMRTRSVDALYTFTHTRVIMNVLNGSLRDGFDNFPFSSIDGLGILLHRIEETAIAVCRKLYRGRALFGVTEADAFECECSFINNDLDDLENGNVQLFVYAAPAPGVEKVLISTFRVGIGQVAASAADGSAIS